MRRTWMKSAVIFVALLAATAAAQPTASLTWRVYPADPTTAKSPVEVVLAIGSAAPHTIKLAPQLGQIPAIYEHVCGATAFPLKRGEVAQVTFEEGGFGGFVARIDGTTLEVVEWNMSDGLCGPVNAPVPCPRHDKLAAHVEVPAGMKLVEHLELVDAKGASHPFSCAD